MISWIKRFFDLREPEPKVFPHLEYMKMQAEREDRHDDWRRKSEQQQIDTDYFWEYVEMRRREEDKLIALLRTTPSDSRMFSLLDDTYVFGLLITPIYKVVHNSAKYVHGGTNIHKEYEEYMEKQRPYSNWDIIDSLRKPNNNDKQIVQSNT